MESSSSLEGKACILTGGSSGIGLGFAKALIARGCNVIIGDLQLTEDAQQLISSTADKTPRAIYQKTDVTSWADLASLFETAIKEFGAVDIVCPNAGVFEPSFSSFWKYPGSVATKDTPEDSRYGTIDINLNHPIRLTQMAIGYYQSEERPGTVLLVSSIANQTPTPTKPIYCATKAGIAAFTRSLALLDTPPPDSGLQRVKVVAVAPGITTTPLWHTLTKREQDSFAGAIFEYLQPSDIADAMAKFVTEDEWKGGDVLEVTHGGIRRVANTMDPGPPMGEKLGAMSEEERWKMFEPTIRLVFEAEAELVKNRGW